MRHKSRKEKKSILVVDDDKDILESLRIILQSEGYRVDTAETGRETMEKTKTRFYHLALLNIWLPDMKDETLLMTLQESFPEMVKIMLTGLPPDRAREFLNLGADAYFIKPVDPDKLLKVVKEKLIENRKTLLLKRVPVR